MIRAYFCIMYCVLTFASPLHASTEALHQGVENAFQYKSGYNFEQRRALAEAQNKYWADFFERMPPISLSDRAKVLNGIRSPDNFKHAEAMLSKEGLIHLSIESVKECKIASDALLRAVGLSKKSEVLAWIKLIKCYDNVRSVPFLLREAGIMKKEDYREPYSMQGVNTWASRTAGVLESLMEEWSGD